MAQAPGSSLTLKRFKLCSVSAHKVVGTLGHVQGTLDAAWDALAELSDILKAWLAAGAPTFQYSLFCHHRC